MPEYTIHILTEFTEGRTGKTYRPGETYTADEMGWDETRIAAYAARGRVRAEEMPEEPDAPAKSRRSRKKEGE